jgi:hypothetical protein
MPLFKKGKGKEKRKETRKETRKEVRKETRKKTRNHSNRQKGKQTARGSIRGDLSKLEEIEQNFDEPEDSKKVNDTFGYSDLDPDKDIIYIVYLQDYEERNNYLKVNSNNSNIWRCFVKGKGKGKYCWIKLECFNEKYTSIFLQESNKYRGQSPPPPIRVWKKEGYALLFSYRKRK